MYCRSEGLCEVTPGGVKQLVCHAFPTRTSTTKTQRPDNIQKGMYQHPQIDHRLQTLSLPEKQWKKEETVVISASSSSRVLQQSKEAAAQKQMFWSRRHEETRSKTSKLISSCLLRFVPNKLWKHNPNTVYMLFSKSVLNSYCVPWLLCVIHWESKDQGELCVHIVYFYKAQYENRSK